MTKSLKHKKWRKKEVTKAIIKKRKVLKKGQNESKTEFKVRKILMQKQLAEKKDNVQSKKKLNIKDLLNRLHHHNSQIRGGSLGGIKEVLTKYDKLELMPSMAQLMRGIMPCILDDNPKVREATVKIIECIILKIGSMIEPYFSIISSHLCCAMVALSSGIQEDSLRLMDVLLCHTSPFIARSANAVLHSYFYLISTKMFKGPSKKRMEGDSSVRLPPVMTHVLISQPESRFLNASWRLKLLRSLSRYLEAILGQKTKVQAAVPTCLWELMGNCCDPPPCEVAISSEDILLLTEESSAKDFIEPLLPILYQTWMETGLGSIQMERACRAGTHMDPRFSELVKVVSEIIISLWNITESACRKDPAKVKWFIDGLGNSIGSEFFMGFPYSLPDNCEDIYAEEMEDKKRLKPTKFVPKKPKMDLTNDSIESKDAGHGLENWKRNCLLVNVRLASLAFLYLHNNKKAMHRVAQFYCDMFSGVWGAPADIRLDSIMPTACDILKAMGPKEEALQKQLLQASMEVYEQLPKGKNKDAIIQLPTQAIDMDNKHLWKSKELSRWMHAVVDSVAKDPSDEAAMEFLLQLRLRNTPGFDDVWHKKKAMFKKTFMKASQSIEESV